AHHFKTTLRGADPTHAMLNSAWTQPGLGQLEPRAQLTEQIPGRHATVFETNLAVSTNATGPHHRHRAHNVEAARVCRNENHAGASVRCRARVGYGHHDRERRTDGATRKPLVPVDHPF